MIPLSRGADDVDEPVIEVPDWPADRMLELEDVRDDPELGGIRHNDQHRGQALSTVVMWFVATLALGAAVTSGINGDFSGAALAGAAGVIFAYMGYQLTRELICYLGGPDCRYCRREDARWRANGPAEGDR